MNITDEQLQRRAEELCPEYEVRPAVINVGWFVVNMPDGAHPTYPKRADAAGVASYFRRVHEAATLHHLTIHRDTLGVLEGLPHGSACSWWRTTNGVAGLCSCGRDSTIAKHREVLGVK